MERMAQWAVIIPADQWATERLFHNEVVTVAGAAGPVAPDDEVLLVADGRVVALTRATKTDGDDLVLAYVRPCFDSPLPAAELTTAGPASARAGEHAGGAVRAGEPASAAGVVPVAPESFRRLAAVLDGRPRLGARPTWLVSVALPIEAETPAEAVRQFWSHVRELGPAELPAYVWPSGDELAMQSFVLGEQANQDPEEDEDD
jgi:hypothetical protein